MQAQCDHKPEIPLSNCRFGIETRITLYSKETLTIAELSSCGSF